MTSEELKTTQITLETLAKKEIDSPMTSYAKVKRLLKIVQEVDTLRRETWNEEKFGESDKVANILYNDFSSDDIPF